MNDLLFRFVQVLEATEDLRYDELGFLLWYLLMLLEVEIEVGTLAQFKDSAEAVMINLNSVKVSHHSPIDQVFMDIVLSDSMLDVALFDLLSP